MLSARFLKPADMFFEDFSAGGDLMDVALMIPPGICGRLDGTEAVG